MENCFFCSEALERGKIVCENDRFYARLSDVPVSPGSIHIILKDHKESLFDLDGEEWRKLKEIIEKARDDLEKLDLEKSYQQLKNDVPRQKFREFIQEALDSEFLDREPDGFNIGVNEGEAAGRSIDHFHLHLIPRYKGDVDEKRYGIRHIFPEKARYE